MSHLPILSVEVLCDLILIPSGAQLDMTGLVVVDESVKPVVRNTTPKRHSNQ